MIEKIGKKHLIINLTLCIVGAIAFSVVFSFLSEIYIIRQSEKNIQNLLLSHKGIHHYVQQRMLPALYEYKKQEKLPEEFYAPELFSSSFIVRNQHEFYNQELADAGFPQLYYKLAANNPRNPVNKADALEKELIEKFNKDRSLKKYREIISLDNKKYLYVAIPFLENAARCMICHGKRENAPQELQEKYPGEGGFNEKIGEIRAITSIRAPLNQVYKQLFIIIPSLAFGTFLFAFLMFFNSQLRNKIRRSTDSLKTEIQEKQKIASKLQESEKYLKSIQDSMQVGLLLIDQKTYEIVDVNKVALELIGSSRENILGKRCFSLLCPAEQNACPINDRKQEIHKSERVLIDSKGNRIPVLKTATILNFNEKNYILETFIDITAQKEIEAARSELEKQLHQSQKMEAIGTLAGGIAHDFNNILSVILGYASIAQDDAPPDSDLSDDLRKILAAGYRAKDLVQQILTFSRQAQTTRYPLQPGLIIKEAVKMLRASIPTTIEIEEKINNDCGLIDADPTQIHQIFMNLCTNAFHAMEHNGGKLTITLEKAGRVPKEILEIADSADQPFIYMAVSDTGHGMSREVANKIFDPFFTTKEKGKGTGLGLSTTYGIIKEYGGFIMVDSEVGKGSVFHIYLPASKSKTVPVDLDEKIAPPHGKERILFIDDEDILLDMGKNLLERLGYSVTVMKRGFDALELFQKQPDQFDLIITDQTMPGITGSDLARRMIQIRPDIPIILCTGYSNIIDEVTAKSFGIREYALKPLTKSNLAHLIRKVLDKEPPPGQ